MDFRLEPNFPGNIQVKQFFLAISIAILAAVPAYAQQDKNSALNYPDQVAWQLFLEVTAAAGGNNALFETWASDNDTFQEPPAFPVVPSPLSPHQPALLAASRTLAQEHGKLLPALPPNGGVEESRRNQAAWTFIKDNGLYKVSGLKAAFGKTISFPPEAIEVKGFWMKVENIPAFTNNKVSIADVPRLYHVNKDDSGQAYGLLALHVISKLVPNWTWATFEQRLNPRRCDVLGCKDSFGAVAPDVRPNQQDGQGYPDCAKTPALAAMIQKSKWDPAFVNYCLKGSQTDFTNNTGLAVRLGNSVIEGGNLNDPTTSFVATSSCITCHGRAGWDASGHGFGDAGFMPDGSGPLGPIDTARYWTAAGGPPVFEGMPGLKRVATSADFAWSIPFCALDDTVNPPRRSCRTK